MKRHTRPYICTFPGCSTRHGSRSDWKRHEETQHPLRESWKCTAHKLDGTTCLADFTSENELQDHLLIAHGMSETEVTRGFCENMHLGENGVGRFWCVFCQEIVRQEVRSSCDSREMRMQHVGDHFDRD
jgi:hypothetical protein